MRNYTQIVFLIGVSLFLHWHNAYAQDANRLGERTIMGTARYVGMAGAMTAVGGDPTAVLDNPAGLGIYRRSEGMLSVDFARDRTVQSLEVGARKRPLVMMPQAAFVLSFITKNTETGRGALFHNFMFSFHRVHSFYRSYYAQGGPDASLGALIASTDVAMDIPYTTERKNIFNSLLLSEKGYVHEYTFDWGTNISNRWYIGAGLHVQSYFMTADADAFERFGTVNADGVQYSNLNTTFLRYSGAGCTLSFGFIYRPVQWLRLGMAVQTPSWGSLSITTSGKLTAQTDSLRASYAPNGTNSETFHMPLHASSSIAFQLGTLGMLSFQYDYRHARNTEHMHSLRAGVEIVPVAGLYINAGYAYESAFRSAVTTVPIDKTFDRQDAYFQYPRNTQYASVALGYRGTYLVVQAAYQYRWQKISLYAHQYANPYLLDADTHRVVFTIGWHRAWP